MATCFLFTQHLNDDSCLSLSLGQQGQVEAPLAQRSFTDIKILQQNAQTIVIAPTDFFTLHQVELPWLADRKARAAIPFALEDKLAQNVDSLHFAFDRAHYQAGHYLVVVGDKRFLTELINTFDNQGIRFDSLTLDWFGLQQNEAAVTPTNILVNDAHFQGALSPELAALYCKSQLETSFYRFKDSNESLMKELATSIKETEDSWYCWLAKRLQNSKSINLCQGELQHSSTPGKTKRWYQAAIAMSTVWLLSILAVNAVKLYFLNKDLAQIDTKIATIYHEFFPQAQQVISPRFRINQLLKANHGNMDATFWVLLDKLASTFNSNNITFEQLRFQNQTLLVTLATKNFAELEDLQTRLQQKKVKVKQTQAATTNEQVVGILELNL
ncbi:general secretion pathway protein L [Legionella donaldsonii]|uniref:Type II secretion system protein L n=1 Tax=Legionella donaldsonii TaxID=45060 RepID=A0A378J322_9GAMM|nr:type II secretion system protein GspL [Legionella donaldsonii]STX41371.1 general secretion pathway protein L [Legionella donaldsonii]